MNKILYSICLLLLWGLGVANAQNTLADRGIKVSNLSVACSDGVLHVSMNVDASELEVRSNEDVIFTPFLLLGDKRMDLEPICFSGRNSYIRRERNNKEEIDMRHVYRAKKLETISYQSSVPFEKWMETADLMIEDSRCGCLDKLVAENTEKMKDLDFVPRIYQPEYVYLPPVVVDEKVREASGSAYIDYMVSNMKINEDYRNNRSELQRIYATIDSVKNNPDATVTKVTFKGYASPEGSYALNTRLAEGRTKSLMQHVQQLYAFPEGVIEYTYEPEDWAGLKKYVENSSMANKDVLLEVINNTELNPDAREWRLKSKYAEDYKFLLQNVYPGLRHSDYTIKYTIRAYTDVEEAKRVMQERPGNLSLHEFYMVANTYEVGSEEYNDVFDVMVRVYPNDPTANLNAANVSMSRGNLINAKRFLDKSGDSALAEYARGVLAAIQKDHETARKHFRAAEKGGIPEATKALAQLDYLER